MLFDAGAVRYASMRAPGAYWTEPEPIGPAAPGRGRPRSGLTARCGGRAVAPEDAAVLAVFRMTAGHAAARASFPAPRAGARDLFPALVAPAAGSAHVIYVERGATQAGAGCAVRTAVLAVDVPAQGATLPSRRLDAFDATGEGTPDICHLAEGRVILGSPLLAADAAGADTAVYSLVAIESLTATPLARHREPGGDVADLRDGAAGGRQRRGRRRRAARRRRRRAAGRAALRGGQGDRHPRRRSLDARGAAPRRRGRQHLPGRPDRRGHDGLRVGRRCLPGATVGRVADASGMLGAPVTLRETGSVLLAVSGDARGNALALYSRPGGDAFVLGATDYRVEAPPEAAPDPDPVDRGAARPRDRANRRSRPPSSPPRRRPPTCGRRGSAASRSPPSARAPAACDARAHHRRRRSRRDRADQDRARRPPRGPVRGSGAPPRPVLHADARPPHRRRSPCSPAPSACACRASPPVPGR